MYVCSIYLQEILPLLKQFSVILWLGDYTYHCIRSAVLLVNLVFFSSVNFKHLGHNTCCQLVMRMPVKYCSVCKFNILTLDMLVVL